MEKGKEITAAQVLHKYWGHKSFRMKQEDIVLSVLAGRDTLALLPTGGGKSVCFQVPVMCREGIGIVVSPLVALMQDQVQALGAKGIRAYAINSFMSRREIDVILDNCIYGEVKFLYVSPERLNNETFLVRLRKMKVSLLAVDEAHCISQWGYDFRPSYLQIADLRKELPGVPVLALTASATPEVVKDIQDKLQFRDPHVIRSSFARENLVYVVYKVEDKESKLLEVCRNVKGQGIVYCGTRQRTKEVAEFLRRNKVPSTFYHAGLTHPQRRLAQESWFKGKHRVICATNAFGMGIDKPDVRFVVHMDVPSDPEAYFQEAGRGGRDGNRAYSLLMFNQADVEKLPDKIEVQFPSKEIIRATYRAVCSFLNIAVGAGDGQVYSLDLPAVCKQFSLGYKSAYFSLQLLERAGYIGLGEGWSEPSKLFFTVKREVLYNYQVAHPAMDSFIKLLLRMYGGMFDQYVPIREADIARAAKMTIAEVTRKLQQMVQNALVDYKPQSELPRVSFLISRVQDQHLRIPPEVYENRKTSARNRTQSMLHFLETARCRSVQLLEYFGEKNAKLCGKCDVCVSKKQSGLDLEELEVMTAAIVEQIVKKPLKVEELTGMFPSFPSDHILQLVRWKIDQEEWLLQDDLRLTINGME